MATKKDLIQYSNLCRGSIINSFISLERQIDYFLSRFFCPGYEDRWYELIEIFFATNRMTFDAKREAFKFIVKTHYPTFIEKYPSFINDVDIRIMPKRNLIAHSELYMGDECITEFENKKIGFVRYSNTNEIKWLTVDEISTLQKLINKTHNDLLDFINENITNDKAPSKNTPPTT